MSLKKDIHRLADIFAEMVKNYSSMGEGWKNLSLVKDAFALMQSLPDTLPGEYETPAEKGSSSKPDALSCRRNSGSQILHQGKRRNREAQP